jgi:23S rRNA (pseudouridine1915-N3)-methyltransferase
MRVRVIAVGTRMPRWVDEVFDGYVVRLRSRLPVTLTEIGTGPRADRGLLAALRPGEFLVMLDERGREFRTRALVKWLGERMVSGRDLAFVIGGPDGLAREVLERADLTWSLSQLTLPHALVRVILAEQLYRAHSVLAGHPYHRE